MFQKVKDKFLEYVEYPEDQITENTEIIKDMHVNSLDIMIMLGDFEVEYNIKFETEEIQNIVTVGDFVNLLKNKVIK